MNLLVCSPAFIGVFSAWLSHSARELGRISLLVAAAAAASLQTEGDVHPIVITQPAEVLGLGRSRLVNAGTGHRATDTKPNIKVAD